MMLKYNIIGLGNNDQNYLIKLYKTHDIKTLQRICTNIILYYKKINQKNEYLFKSNEKYHLKIDELKQKALLIEKIFKKIIESSAKINEVKFQPSGNSKIQRLKNFVFISFFKLKCFRHMAQLFLY